MEAAEQCRVCGFFDVARLNRREPGVAVEPLMNLARRCSQVVAQVRLWRNCRPRRAFETGHGPARHECIRSRFLRCGHQQADPTSVTPLASNPFAEGWWWTLVREIRLWSTRTAPSTDDVEPPMELQTQVGSFCSMGVFSATQICVSTGQIRLWPQLSACERLPTGRSRLAEVVPTLPRSACETVGSKQPVEQAYLGRLTIIER